MTDLWLWALMAMILTPLHGKIILYKNDRRSVILPPCTIFVVESVGLSVGRPVGR